MSQINTIEELQEKRDHILEQIRELGDFRQGSFSPRYRKCGKPYCHCAKQGAKGHGPLWLVTRAVNGKTVSKSIPKDKVDLTFEQIEKFHNFQTLMHKYVETNIKICDAKLEEHKAVSSEAKKKGSTKK